jgi:hypothetical protein
MLTPRELLRQFLHSPEPHPWWVLEACRAIGHGRHTLIRARHADELYLARFWMHEPRWTNDGEPESGNSCMLHYFARPDDDDALHDHPWDFETTVLSGGYLECEPPPDWDRGDGGPQHNYATRLIRAGMSRFHRADDLHRVASLAPNTWTLMRTGPRKRLWGFHAEGRVWQPWHEYLGTEAAK